MTKMKPDQARRFATLANELFDGRLSVVHWDTIERWGEVRFTKTFDMTVHEYDSGGCGVVISDDGNVSTPGVNVAVEAGRRKIIFRAFNVFNAPIRMSWRLVPTGEDDGLYDSFVELHKISVGLE